MIAVRADRGVEPNLPTAFRTESEPRSGDPGSPRGISSGDVDDCGDKDSEQDHQTGIRAKLRRGRSPVVGQDDTEPDDEEDDGHYRCGFAFPRFWNRPLTSRRLDRGHANSRSRHTGTTICDIASNEKHLPEVKGEEDG